MLIHSRYTFSDRRNQEKRLLGGKNTNQDVANFIAPRILVSTQIVEVSLDINYDALFTEACYLDSLVRRAGRINRNANLGNEGQGLVKVCLPQGDLPYDSRLLNQSVKLLSEEYNKITSELDYIRLTNRFYDENWQSSIEAEERFGRIWRAVYYIYRVDLSDIEMQKLLRTRSGLVTVNAYSRTHRDTISKLDDALSSLTSIKERTQLYRQIRLYSINVPLIGSTRLTQMENKHNSDGGMKYLIVEADYDKDIGLMIDL